MRVTIKALAAALVLCGGAMAASPAYERAQGLRAEAEEAMARGDYAAAEAALEQALTMRANHPGIMLALAAAEARLGKDEEALDHLEQFVGMGLAANLGADEAFAGLIGEPRFTGVLSRIERNLLPVGTASVASTRLARSSTWRRNVACSRDSARSTPSVITLSRVSGEV